jgi:hypothetical protein
MKYVYSLANPIKLQYNFFPNILGDRLNSNGEHWTLACRGMRVPKKIGRGGKKQNYRSKNVNFSPENQS